MAGAGYTQRRACSAWLSCARTVCSSLPEGHTDLPHALPRASDFTDNSGGYLEREGCSRVLDMIMLASPEWPR